MPCQLPALPSTPSALPSSSFTAPNSSNILKKEQTCSNCKSCGVRFVGHTDATCFHLGGGMEGCHKEYFSNNGRIHAMFAECLENAFLLSEPPLPPDTYPPLDSPVSPALDSELLLPPIANLSVASFVLNTDLHEDVYNNWSDNKPFTHIAMATIDFNSTALLSLHTTYNALLDSGCTHHIVCDHTLFWSYSAQAVSVGTANCGSLEALGTGNVEFRHHFGD